MTPPTIINTSTDKTTMTKTLQQQQQQQQEQQQQQQKQQQNNNNSSSQTISTIGINWLKNIKRSNTTAMIKNKTTTRTIVSSGVKPQFYSISILHSKARLGEGQDGKCHILFVNLPLRIPLPDILIIIKIKTFQVFLHGFKDFRMKWKYFLLAINLFVCIWCIYLAHLYFTNSDI